MNRVVIVGGGFGGLSAAKRLSSRLQIDLLDRRNHHLFQPLLYQVATAGLSPADIAAPIRAIVAAQRNTRVHLAEVKAVDFVHRRLQSDIGEFKYDYLILACGSTDSYFNHSEWEHHAPGLKTLEQATEIRRRILLAFERAEDTADEALRRALLTFVVVGGGPTGVELAGALAELGRFTLVRDFRNIDPTHTRVVLVEAADRVLSSFSPRLSARAARDLQRLGVEIHLSTRVTDITDQGVHLGDQWLGAQTVLWAAGVQPSKLNQNLGLELDKAGRVIVGPDLSPPGHPEVFVIGDQAHCKGPSGAPLPGLAPVAIQQGYHCAQSIHADLKGRTRGAFVYKDKGQMATIGRKKAIAQTRRLEFGGWPAWLAWLGVHIYYLIGFRNRLFVLMSWAWAYFTFSRGARLIVGKSPHPSARVLP